MERWRVQRSRGWSVLAMSLALLLSRALHAEQAGADQPPDSDVEVMHVRAVRAGQLPEAPSAFATAIDVESFEGENKSVADLLEEAVGVQVRRFGGAGQQSEVSIRGSNGRQVVILLDGVRINSVQSGSVDLSSIPRDLIERIEVVRGGGSVQTGGAAIGGVVNIVTKRGGGAPTLALTGARSSFETWQASLAGTGTLLGTDLALGYEYFRTKGDWRFAPLGVVIDGVPVPPTDPGPIERVNNRDKSHSGLLKLGRDVGDHLQIEISDQLFHGDGGRPGLDQDAGGALHGQSQHAHAWRTRNVADVSLRAHSFAPGQLEAVLRGFHRFERNRFEDTMPPTGPMLDSDDRDRSYGGRLELSAAARLGPTQHAPFLGVDLFRDVLDSQQAQSHARRVFGFALQDEISLFARRLRIVPALRYDGTGGFDSQWLPRVGVILAPWSWLRFKGNAERAYRAPNFNELYFNEGSLRGNPALRPEQSRNFDLGVELLFDRIGPLRRASFEAVAFRNEIANSIVFQPISPNVVAATNVSDARARGVELSGGVGLSDWLRLGGNWTRLDTEILRTGNPLPGRPAHELLLRVELGPKSGLFKLVGERRETAAIPANEGGSRLISGRTVYDASASVDVSQLLHLGERFGLRSLLLSVSGTNLGDVSVRDAQSFPQPGRVLAFRIEVHR